MDHIHEEGEACTLCQEEMESEYPKSRFLRDEVSPYILQLDLNPGPIREELIPAVDRRVQEILNTIKEAQPTPTP